MDPHFYQEAPALKNPYLADRTLQSLLSWLLPADVQKAVEKELKPFGDRVLGDLQAWAKDAEAHPPQHVPYSPWGRRADEIRTSSGWQSLKEASAQEGLVAIGYERKNSEHSRLHQFAKLFLFHPSSSFFSCPLAMTDGAARVLELHLSNSQLRPYFNRLTTRDARQFWTSGQWMTERTGGSDVSNTSTRAQQNGDTYRLYGTKWFSSSTTSEMALALARIDDAGSGNQGLSLFLIPTRNEKTGESNNIEILRLKDKLGTRALPTAELQLNGAEAILIGEPGKGVKTVASMLNITRLYNSVCSIAHLRRGLFLAEDYAKKRVAFGKHLIHHPLHTETLSDVHLDLVGGMALTFHLAKLMGREETGKATHEEATALRLLTPICKLMTAKWCLRGTSEIIESFGGAGYIEDTGLPLLLRDAQVFPIWEGTTNVLSLDALRVIKQGDNWSTFTRQVEEQFRASAHPSLGNAREELSKKWDVFLEESHQLMNGPVQAFEASARKLMWSLGEMHVGALLLTWAGSRLQLGPAPYESAVASSFIRRLQPHMCLITASANSEHLISFTPDAPS